MIVDTARSPSAGKLSCVVDTDLRFHLEAVRWFATLSGLAGVKPSDLVIHAVDGCDSEILQYLRDCGVTVRSVERFDQRSPHCNKISGALALSAMEFEGVAVLTDSDVVFLEDPRKTKLPDTSVASKTVDGANPPLRTLRATFTAAGLSRSELWPVEWEPSEATLAGNANGGLYVIPRTLLPRVSAAWAHWARWLLDHIDLLAERAVNVDQVAMAMALAAEGIDPMRLEIRWNFPTHKPDRIAGSKESPAVIHYHDNLDDAGLLARTGTESVDHQIDIANAAIRQIWHEAVPKVPLSHSKHSTDPPARLRSRRPEASRAEQRSLLSTLAGIVRRARSRMR